MHIKDKCAVVVGGVQGIGYAYCKTLLKKGARVYIGDIQEEKGKLVEEEFREEFGPESTYFCKVDVRKTADVEEIFKRAKDVFGRIDIAIGNAGIVEEFNWELCVDINLKGVIRVTNEAFKYMAKDKGGNGGVMVHTASIAGVRPDVWVPVYAATKHGVVALCRSWALEENYGLHGVRMNSICPAGINTGIHKQLIRSHFPSDIDIDEFFKSVEFVKMTEMEEALIELIEDDCHNGTAMRITTQCGREVHTYQETPPQ